ncbi:hypothetical protein SEUCBS139899_005766 [Sporothrix eucalyptigena]
MASADMTTDGVLPLLEPPGEFEGRDCYLSFPSRLRLLSPAGSRPGGACRRPSLTLSWRPNGLNGARRLASPRQPCASRLEHAIYDCCERSNKDKIVAVLGNAPHNFRWMSVDVMRPGCTKTPEDQHPVVMYVESSPELSPSWAVTSDKLRRIRRALDDNGLFDVQYEIRELTTFKTAGNCYKEHFSLG